MAKKMTATDIENKLQALIGLRYFTQEGRDPSRCRKARRCTICQ